MAWFKVDDRLHSSAKIMSIPKRQRLAAVGLWALAGSWCADQETDGAVPSYMIEVFGAPNSVVTALCDARMWEQTPTGFQFINWEEYQPTRAELEDRREQNREKLRKWRERNRVTNQVTENDVTGYEPVSNPTGGEVTNPAPNPSQPDPSQPDPISNSYLGDASAPTTKTGKGTRINPDWNPSRQTVQQLAQEHPQLDTRAEHLKFIDYWLAQPGTKGVKLDWEATWRNWMRKAAETQTTGYQNTAQRMQAIRATAAAATQAAQGNAMNLIEGKYQ